jgi:tetratricopeptide (TPR) repeat protein
MLDAYGGGQMKFRSLLAFFFLLSLALAGVASGMSAGWQEGVAKGPIITRDPELEKQSQKSLEAAKFYFYRRKPEKKDPDGWSRLNKSIEGRLTEIIDTNASFSRIDEVYFMLGELYKRTGDNEKAVENWRQALKETSNDKIKSDSQKRIDEMKVAEKK